MPDIDAIAKQIVLANVNGEQIPPLTEPLSVTDAYKVQDACIKFAKTYEGLPKYMPRLYTRVGYKIGATSKEIQEYLGLTEPFHGPIFSGSSSIDNSNDDQDLSASSFAMYMQHKPRVEAEFVVSLKHDLIWEGQDFSIENIADYIDWIAPGLEFVGSRFESGPGSPGTSVIADLGANEFMLVGKPYRDWKNLDLSHLPASLGFAKEIRYTNQWAEPVVHGHSGMSVFGNPLGAVCWLLNHETLRNTGVKAGEWISCGTCTGALPLEKDLYTTAADFGVLGKMLAQAGGLHLKHARVT